VGKRPIGHRGKKQNRVLIVMAALFIAGFIAAGALGQVGSLSISGSSASSDSSSTSTDTTASTDTTQTSTDSTTSDTTTSDTTAASTDATTTSTTATTTSSAPVYYLVKFAAGTSSADQAAALTAAGATDLSYIAPLRLHSVSFPADAADAHVATLSANTSVTRVEVDKSRDVAGSPNDADYGQQWSLPRIGWDQVYGNVSPGGSATVAILDTGVEASHPDLAGKIVAGTNVITHSGDGESDPNGHGTAMAGIVAAATNNDIGIAGVGFAGVRVMPVTVLDAQGLGQDSDIIEGVVYAADHGANVILMSFSNPGYSASLQDAIDYAWSQGLVVVAATGNDGSSTVNFPAGDRGVIGVGSTDEMDVPSSFSNIGADVFLAAPGENILTTSLDGYGPITGTSAAAAEVAGAAALMKASSVGTTNGVIVNRLAESADASGTGTQTGNGRLNLARAIADTSSNSIEPAGAAPVGGGGPYVGPYVAAAGTRTTSTAVDCNTAVAVAVGTARSCTVTVTDTMNSGQKSAPTGTFNVTASGASVSPTSASCVLAVVDSKSSNCTVSFTGGATGTITVTASYPGDGAHAASSDTDTITVKRNSSTSVSCPDVILGQASSCTITVTDPDSGLSTPTGSVSLSASGASVSPTSTSCTLSGGGNSTSCTASFTGGATGTISVTASYPGDTTHVASSGSDSITVSKRATSTTVSCASPVLPNAASSCTVTVSDTSGGTATTPTGTVSLTASGAGASPASTTCNLSGSAGTATCSANFTGNAAGTISVNASYPGDTTHATSSGSGSITVSLHATTTAVSCASPAVVGAASSCTITVTDTSAAGATTPGGTVNLTASGAGASPASTSCTLSGSGSSATCSASFTGSATGTISVSASYAGDSSHATSSGSGSITVNKRATSTTVVCNSPIALNGTSDCIATVNDTSPGTATTPTGTVSFTASGGGVSPTSASCTLSGSGSSASCTVTFTGGSTGTISVSASYGGDGTHSTSSGAGSIDVKRASSTSVSCASPVIIGQASSCTVTVTDSSSGGKTTPTGTFNVTASGAGVSPASASCVLSGGGASATCAVSFTGSGAGTISVFAPYPGDANHAASSGTDSVTVNAQAPTSLAVSPASGTYGGTADLTATLTSGGSGVNAKAISFSLNGNSVGNATTNASGVATLAGVSLSGINAGTYTNAVSATFAGDSGYSSSSGSANLTVAKASQTITFNALANKTFGDADFTVSASASSGLAVSFSAAGNCTVSGSTVHITGAGSCTITASQGGNSNYNAATDVSRSFSIAKAQATLALSNLNQTYDGSPKAVTVTTTPSGLSGVSVTYDGAATAPTNAGSYAVVATLTNPNYQASNATGTLVVAKAGQTITFAALANKTYGDADFTVSATASSGLSVSFSAAGNCTVSGNSVHITGAGSCTVTASQGGSSNYNAAADVSRSFSIAKAQATLALSNLNQTYDGSAKAVTVTTTPSGLSGVSVTYDGSTTAPTNAGSYAVVASLSNANYQATDASGTLVIAKANQTITFNALANKTYGDPDFTVSATASSGLPVSFSVGASDNCTISGATIHITGAGSCTVTASQGGNSNYNAAPDVSRSFSIAKASQTISFAALADKTYGDVDFTVSASASSGLTVSFAATGDCTVSGATVHITGAGSCTVTASQGGNANYNAAPDVSRSFSIAKASQTISFAALADKTYGDADFTVSAPASSGLPVSFSVGASDNCTISGATVHITGAGSCTVTASQGGNSNYNAAADVSRSFSIAKAQATLALSNLNQTYDGSAKAVTVTTTPSGLSGVSVTYDGSSQAPTNAGSYAVVASLSNANYQATDASGTLVIAKASQTITFAALADKTYGDADFIVSATASSGLTVSFSAAGDCTVSGATVHITGAGSCTVTASQGGNANYEAAADVSRSFSIGKAQATLALSGLNQTYDGSAKAVTVTTTPSGLSGVSVTYDGSSQAPTNAGSYAVMASLSNANYQATDASGTLVIAKASQTISFAALADKTYGDPDFTVSATASSGLAVAFSAAGDCTVSGGTVHITGAGSCTVTASQDGNANYEAAADVSRSFSIAKAQATLAFAAGTLGQTYDGSPRVVTVNTSPSGLSGVSVTYDGFATVPTNAGSYAVSASLSNANYQASSISGTLVVAKASQTITFDALAGKTYGDADFTVSATASSGLAVSFSATGDCTVSGATVHITGAGSCTVTASRGGNANYEAAADVSRSFSIAKAQATLALSNLSQTYDGSANAVTVTTTPSGLSGVSVTYDGSATAPTNAGSYAVVASLSNANYQATDATGTLVIAKADQTIAFDALAGKTYGDADFTVSASATSGLAVSFSAIGNCTVSGSTVHITGAGSCTITASQAGNSNYNASPDVSRSFSIAKADQTISFGALADKTYGDADFTVSATASSGLTVSFSATGYCTVSGSTVHIAGAGSCTITASQGGNSNYNAAQDVARTFSVAKANQTITFAALANKTYGDADFTVNATASSGLPVSFSVGAGDNCTISGATVHITGAGSCTVTGSQGGNSNYNAAADVSRSFSIAKAQATLALSNLNQTYDGSAKAVTVTTTPSGLSGVSVTYDGSTTAPTNAGSYAVVASLSNANYQATDASGTLVIAKANQTITFDALAGKTYGDPDFAVSATASSGLSVSFSATGNCTVSGATVHITGAGSCTITASQGGNGNYNAAPDVARTFSIAKANQTITFNALAGKTYGDADFTVSATASSYLPVSFSAAGNCTVSGSTVHITGAGTCTITASQGGNANYNAAADVSRSFAIAKAQATLTIDPSSLSKTYNGSPQGVSVSTTPGGLSGVSVTYAGSATVPTNAGSYAVVASLSNANYQAADAPGTLVVAKANQTISFAALGDKTYGDADFAVSASASSGLTVLFSATGNCTVSGTTVHITGAGTCTITASQGGNSNYNAATDVARSFSIAKANQTITFNALAGKTYGDADFTVSASASSGLAVSFSAAGNCTVSGSTVHITGAGSCTITASQGGDANYYAAADVSRSFSIAQAVLQVEPTPKTPSRQYSDPNPSFSPNITGYKNGDGVSALTMVPTCATTATTNWAPGNYPITCSGGAAANYSFNYTAGTLTVTSEDADADFSGALFYAVPSGSATVTLSATITDAADGNRGDVRNAKVTFLVDGTAKCSSLPVGLVSSGDTTVGAATCNVSLGYGSTGSTQYTIGIKVDGFYSRYDSSDDAVVTVSQAISSMITGGGFLKNTASSGLFAGTAGLKTNFGFNVKYNKSNTNLQGNINTIVRSGGRVYQIKGNSMTSLSNQVNSSTGQGGTSTFNGKASIQDITIPAAPISVDGNASLQVTMTDNGEPGSNDTIGITVWNKNGGLWFSSNWSGTKTLEQLLGGGNLVVR
jgi:MBG domain/MBG domain (YGX type)